jgi:hypothetical protein
MDIYGILSDGVHHDVSKTLHGAKCYATRNGYTTVTIRYNCGYIVSEVAHKFCGKWVSDRELKEIIGN